jgi:hypothetical protein
MSASAKSGFLYSLVSRQMKTIVGVTGMSLLLYWVFLVSGTAQLVAISLPLAVASEISTTVVLSLFWRRGARVPWQALGHGCNGLPPQPMMFAKEEPLDDHHHYRL